MSRFAEDEEMLYQSLAQFDEDACRDLSFRSLFYVISNNAYECSLGFEGGFGTSKDHSYYDAYQ